VTRTAWHPDGKQLLVVIRDQGNFAAEVRTVENPLPTARLPLNKTPLGRSAWSPDGQQVAITGNDSRLYLWKPNEPGANPRILTGLNNNGLQVAFNHRGDLLASNGWEGVLRLWDPHTGRQLLSMQTDAIPRFSSDDRFVGLGRAGSTLQIFEVASGRERRMLPGNPSPYLIPQNLPSSPPGDSSPLERRLASCFGIPPP